MSSRRDRLQAFKAGWYVYCDEYEAGPFPTEEDAERERESYKRASLCSLDHHVHYRPQGKARMIAQFVNFRDSGVIR